MRNFYDQPTNKIFNRMFGKQARQIQADPTLDISKCKCCQCDKVECKGCMEGHVVSKNAGCCHSKNNGLIFEYERPAFYGSGMECCPTVQTPCCTPGGPCYQADGSQVERGPGDICPPGSWDPCNGCLDSEGNSIACPDCNSVSTGVRRCCATGKQEHENVRFYYNYVGQYFRIDYECTGKYNTVYPQNGLPRLCSYCDPTSFDAARKAESGYQLSDETCLDYTYEPDFDRRIDDRRADADPSFDPESPCSKAGYSNNLFRGCQCMGDKDTPLEDRDTQGKRLSKYRKRQMEKNAYYRWLLDIMCYDKGNQILRPSYRYELVGEAAGDDSVGQKVAVQNGTLYDHLIGVVHCEHWYEIARCPQNPEHDDPNGVLGGWITDENGNPVGANTSYITPRFWVYACSGVPLFDFEIEDAKKRLDEFGNPLITEDEEEILIRDFALRRTPPQAIMNKLAKGGYLDIGDWRQDALNEINVLRGLSFTKEAYGPTGDETCSTLKTDPNSENFGSYLGPVRKRLWIPETRGGINIPGVTGPARLDPKKARPNTISQTPDSARNEKEVNILTDRTLVDLQLPERYLVDPWNGSYPKEPAPGQTPSEEYQQFVIWRDSQWLYMHAKPGGWDYVCSGFLELTYDDEGNPVQADQQLRIPNLKRRYSNSGNAIGGCLDGLIGWPQRTYEWSGGGCPDITCGDADGNQYPLIGCDAPPSLSGTCFTPDCAPEVPWCALHPEQGGGVTPCGGFALASNCDGIRFIAYRHREVNGSPALSCNPDQSGFVTCSRVVRSYLYRVNLDTGNFGDFCPNTCRTLSVPKTIANLVPRIYSNKLSLGSLCQQLRQGNNCGEQCAGLFCYSDDIWDPVLNPNGPFYSSQFSNESYCCGGKRNGFPSQAPAPTDYTHDASNKTLCPNYPGPPCLTPNCYFYDGKFTGVQLDFNPRGCCWKCEQNGSVIGGYVPVNYEGIKDYFDCVFNINDGSGRGFLYTPGQINSPSACGNQWAGDCACGTIIPNYSPGSVICDPTGLTGDDNTIPGGY
jgi:hypothetical protein